MQFSIFTASFTSSSLFWLAALLKQELIGGARNDCSNNMVPKQA
jgi:hypothetical protein